LIIEIRQNHEYTVAQTRNDISQQEIERRYHLGSEDLAPIILKARNGEQLTELESYKLNQMREVLFQMYENIIFQHSKGLYSEEEFEVLRNGMANLSPGMRDLYIQNRDSYAPSLREIFDEFVEQ